MFWKNFLVLILAVFVTPIVSFFLPVLWLSYPVLVIISFVQLIVGLFK